MAARLRTTLDRLWEKVMSRELEVDLPRSNEIPYDFLTSNKITLISPGFEDKTLTVTSTLGPPVLFKPLDLSVLQSHPIDLNLLDSVQDGEEQLKLRHYDPPAELTKEDEHEWKPLTCSRLVDEYLHNWVHDFPRANLPPDALTLLDLTPLHKISLPNSLLIGPGFSRSWQPYYRDWRDTIMLEHRENNTLIYPHVILMVTQYCNGHDGSIILGELAPLISTMRHRAFQPKAKMEENSDDDSSEEDNSESEGDPAGKTGPPFEFPTEQRFPVLMISLLGSQMGRFYYASMDGSNVVIRQSKLYSFQTQAAAPLDFFTTLLLAHPLIESESVSNQSVEPPVKRAKISHDL